MDTKRYIVKPSTLKGEISVPPSKSHTLRAILFGAMGKGRSVIHRYLASPDSMAMIEACRLFGAKIDIQGDILTIDGLNGVLGSAEDVINAGNSGIVLRFCSAIGALSSHPIVITGDHSIRHQRPMKPLLDGLTQLGVSGLSMRGDGFAPIIVQGPLKQGEATINGEDSQPVSALLIASAFAEGPIRLKVINPGEKPWVALTLDWFDRLGIAYQNENFDYYQIKGAQRYEGFHYTVPGDFSSAAFPIAAALIANSELVLRNIDMSDCQGDKELIAVFQRMGAKIEYNPQDKTLHVRKGGSLKGVEVDINAFIDGITILSVVGCFAEGQTEIRNGAIAKQKECNRIQCIVSELKKMGADIEERGDGLVIKRSALVGTNVHSFNDHRMALSLAVAGLGAKGETIISSTDCVAKTFPSFITSFRLLGAHVEERG